MQWLLKDNRHIMYNLIITPKLKHNLQALKHITIIMYVGLNITDLGSFRI